jgi:predicted  nucleic acid-binding Zn-ribbon protein
VVQDLLGQVRALKVDNERLRLERKEAVDRAGKPDPRLQQLESENRRLRQELAAARERRDALESGLSELVERLRGLRLGDRAG